MYKNCLLCDVKCTFEEIWFTLSRGISCLLYTSISLDSIHRPQVAWKLLGMIIFISIAGVLIHVGISGKASENAAAGSDRYVFHVMIGLAVMMILYLLDYTVLDVYKRQSICSGR